MPKQMLSAEDLDSQVALELPDRALPLVTVIITDVVDDVSIDIDVRNNQVALQVCALVAVIARLSGEDLTCEIVQE